MNHDGGALNVVCADTPNMVIWSILSPEAWQELQSKGSLRASRCHAASDYLASYDWIAQQMERRLRVPRPSTETIPVWAWYQWLGIKRRKPDLRTVRYWHPKGQQSIRVECQVEEERVLLSDYMLWHYVLNRWYLPKTVADGDAFEAKLEAAGLSQHPRDAWHPPEYRREIELSWERVFDIEWFAPDITHPPETRSVQATLWEIELKDVVDAVPFIGSRSLKSP